MLLGLLKTVYVSSLFSYFLPVRCMLVCWCNVVVFSFHMLGRTCTATYSYILHINIFSICFKSSVTRYSQLSAIIVWPFQWKPCWGLWCTLVVSVAFTTNHPLYKRILPGQNANRRAMDRSRRLIWLTLSLFLTEIKLIMHVAFKPRPLKLSHMQEKKDIRNLNRDIKSQIHHV